MNEDGSFWFNELSDSEDETGFSFVNAAALRFDAGVAVNRTGVTGTDRIRSAGMEQKKWTRSGGWCLLGASVDADLPTASKSEDIHKTPDRLSPTGAA